MNTCNIKGYFNPSDGKHRLALKQAVIKSECNFLNLLTLLDNASMPFIIKWEPNTGMKGDEFFNSLEDILKTLALNVNLIRGKVIKGKKVSDKDALSLIDLLKIDNEKIKQTFYSEYKRAILPVDATNIENTPQDTTANLIEVQGALEEPEEPLLTAPSNLKQFLDNTYRMNTGAIRRLKNLFQRNIFQLVVCDLNTGTMTTNNLELNQAIYAYKNRLFAVLSDFVHKQFPNDEIPSVLFENQSVSSDYENVYSLFLKFLDEMNNVDEEVNRGFNQVLKGNQSEFLEALEAFTQLKYFDTFLNDSLGKFIKVMPGFFNSDAAYLFNKYSFNSDHSHYRKSWTDSENRTVVLNTSRFSKFVLDALPLKEDGIDTGRSIGTKQFYSTWTKLIGNKYKLKHTLAGAEAIHLLEDIERFHQAPIHYATKIISKIATSTDLQRLLKGQLYFTDTDINVIKSLHENVFNYDLDMNLKDLYELVDNKTVRAAEWFLLAGDKKLGKYSIVADLAECMNNCMDATYSLTSYGYDGGIEVLNREKYKDRRTSEKYRDTVNSYYINISQNRRRELASTCQVTPKISETGIMDWGEVDVSVAIQVPVEGLTVTLDGEFKYHILSGGATTYGLLHQGSFTLSSDMLDKVRELFGEEGIDLTDDRVKTRLLNYLKTGNEHAVLDEDETLFVEVLKFIDDRLYTNFLSVDGLKKLNYFKTLSLSKRRVYIDDLLLYAAKALLVSNLYMMFNDMKERDKNITRQSFLKKLGEIYPPFANVDLSTIRFSSPELKTYFIINNGIANLRTIPSSTQWVDIYDQASLMVYGRDVASTSKNQSGTNDANYVTAFLGGQIAHVNQKAYQAASERQELINSGLKIPQTAASALLFTNPDVNRIILKTVINSDVKNRAGTVKSIRNMSPSELFYNAIVHNFWMEYLLNDRYSIQSTTYSDKVKIVHHQISAKDLVFKINQEERAKSLDLLNISQLKELYRTSIGRAYRLALDNVVYTYQLLWNDDTLTFDAINKRLKNYTEDLLIKEALAKGLQLQLDLHYRIKKINGRLALSVNETLAHNALYENAEFLQQKMKLLEVAFVNNLVDSGITFYTDYYDTSLFKSKDYDLADIKARLLMSSNPIARIILDLFKTSKDLVDYMNTWVHNDKLVLAYDANGNQILHTNTNTVALLNPLLERFFYTDTLLSNNLRVSLTGFESNHPDVSNFAKIWDNTARANGVINPLLLNSKKIRQLLSARIIWGHPSLGKTTHLLNNPDDYQDFDDFYNGKRDNWLTNNKITNKYAFLEDAHNYITGKKLLIPKNKSLYEQYRRFLLSLWNAFKTSANGKRLVASTLSLAALVPNDFDVFLTIPSGVMLARNREDISAWKASIDTTLLGVDLNKIIDVGNLYMSDIIPLANDFDLYELSKSSNFEVQKMANAIITIIDNVSQGTLLKRNVSIPATMNYIHDKNIGGPATKIKVAVIRDMVAPMYNFSGDRQNMKAMDGAAYTTIELSIMENAALGSLEVGADKKPLWHFYDLSTGTSGLVKFASFQIDNERMLASMNSEVPLIRMYKKMTNMQWAENEIDLTRSLNVTAKDRRTHELKFQLEILNGNKLFYLDYDDPEKYWEIIKFRRDKATGAYYTIELQVNKNGSSLDKMRTVYHWFDADSNYRTTETANGKMDGEHTINSLYELWLAMGGFHSTLLGSDGTMTTSENSHFAVVGFMNNVMTAIDKSNRFNITLDSYHQPLKNYMIGYLANNSALKHGASNINVVDRWFDDEDLAYMEIDTDALGIQQDSDHDVEEDAYMREFTQVITALEAGGFLHKYAKAVYRDLGKVARIASKMEMNAVDDYLANPDSVEVKARLYDVITRSLLNGLKSRDNNAALTDDLLRIVERRFNRNLDHSEDEFKVPFSDSNLYSQILPTIANIINSKSIKREYSGGGFVMVPSYNVIQYFQVNGKRYMFEDILRLARADSEIVELVRNNVTDKVSIDKELVKQYLAKRLKEVPISNTTAGFMPTDIVDVMSGDTVLSTIRLDTPQTYYRFRDGNWASFGINPALITGFRYNVLQAKNLAPAKISFTRTDTGERMNVFDLTELREAITHPSQENRYEVLEAFRRLDEGYFLENGKRVNITDLTSAPAEKVSSNIYSQQFGTGNKSVAQIMDEGAKAFKIEYQLPITSKSYQAVFTKTNGQNLYISFTKPTKNDSYVAWDKKHLMIQPDDNGNLEVYLITDLNRPKFKIGRYILANDKYRYAYSFRNGMNEEIPEAQALRSGYVHKLGKFFDQYGRPVRAELAILRGYSYVPPAFYYVKDGKQVPTKIELNLKVSGDNVYEYIEFVSRYKTREFTTVNDKRVFNEFEKYYINPLNVRRATPGAEDRLRNHFIQNILDSIYNNNQYLGIMVNPELDMDNVRALSFYICHMRTPDSRLMLKVFNPLLEKCKEYANIKEGRPPVLNVSDILAKLYDEYYDIMAQERFNSWKQSLLYTDARIPGQTLQSFMLEEVIAYTGNSRNIVYTSAWNTWLQGSDYDIDKSFMMGFNIGDDGRIIKWSNLFDYNTYETLQASMKLPTPLRIKFFANGENGMAQAEVNIDERVNQFSMAGNNKVKLLEVIAETLLDIYDTEANSVRLLYVNSPKALELVLALRIHESTIIPESLEESAYKNSIVANTLRIVQDMKNMDLAYSPVTLKDLAEIAEESEKGALVASMSMMNPLTKYLMQALNMVGKKVIGIAAVGEKVFFNLSYYWNEGIRKGDERWLRNMQFSQGFTRIDNRYNHEKSIKDGTNNQPIRTAVKTLLANANFMGFDDLRHRFILIDQIHSEVRKRMNVSDEDINNKTDKYFAYQNEVQNILSEVNNNTPESHKYLHDLTRCPPVDLYISQLLSAATDNAKELILAKINCGTSMAGYHLYLLMLGFDIRDIISFMTSPAVSLVSDFTEANMMDSYVSELRIKDAINMANGIVDPNLFLIGDVLSRNDWDEEVSVARSATILGHLQNNSMLNRIVSEYNLSQEFPIKITNLQTFVQAFIKARLGGAFTGFEQQSITDYVKYYDDGETNKLMTIFSDYIERLIYRILKARNKYPNANEYDADLAELSKIVSLSNETTALGSTLLGLNQGLPSDKVELSTRLRRILSAVENREREFGIYKDVFNFTDKTSDKVKENRKNKLDKVINAIKLNNRFAEDEYISATLRKANTFGLIGDFNIEYWLYDKLLTVNDIVNKQFLGEDITNEEIGNFMNGQLALSYRLLVIDYYNLIKGTWNIFDVMDKVPQYNAITDLLKTLYVMDKTVSAKSNLINKIIGQVLNYTHFIDEKQHASISKYVNDLLTVSFFRDYKFVFPISRGTEYIDSAYVTKVADSDRNIDLNTAAGRASFKKAFESILPLLRAGMYNGVEIPDAKNNLFLQDLRIVYDRYEVPRIATLLDLMHVSDTPESIRIYQQYLNGFKKLQDIMIGLRSLADWFIIYNLYVNLNQYGSDRLTSLFRNSIISKGSVLEDYFKYISNLDFNKLDELALWNLGYDLHDVLIRMAPYVSRSLERTALWPYIYGSLSSGERVLKHKRGKSYEKVLTFRVVTGVNAKSVVDDLKANYLLYLMMPMKTMDFIIALRDAVASKDLATLVDALQELTKNGLLQIFKQHC